MTSHTEKEEIMSTYIMSRPDASSCMMVEEQRHGVDPTQSIKLEQLPNELLNHILDFLDSPCPSEVKWHLRPDHNLTQSKTQDLKHISRTSRHLHDLVLPRLFAHVRVDPTKSTSFLSFVARNDLSRHITSVVAHLSGPCTHLHPLWWTQLLNAIPITTFIILCPPYVFAELALTSLVDTDSWVFNMPYQSIRFRQSPSTTSNQPPLTHNDSLFTARPWTSFSVNEGSSLKAYSQYEYFLRKTPSLMAALQMTSSIPALALFSHLTHFTYTAIFPFYNHVDVVLTSVRAMTSLVSLTTKLCPEPGSSVIDDEYADTHGHIDVHDAWMEFDTAYVLVTDVVVFLTLQGRLKEFCADDVKMPGTRENLEEALTRRLQELWTYHGDGLWRRKTIDAESRGIEQEKMEI